jgi:hypothetical protein
MKAAIEKASVKISLANNRRGGAAWLRRSVLYGMFGDCAVWRRTAAAA